MSYENATLYGYAAPYYDYDKDNRKDEWNDSIDANNPENFKQIKQDSEEIYVR